MTKEQFAEMLNGRLILEETSKQDERLAKENGLLVCYGYSDDNLELRGIVDEEIGAYEGTTCQIMVTKNGTTVVVSDEDLEEFRDKADELGIPVDIRSVEVEAKWSPEELECSWLITSKVPHATFDIMEDGELFCRGIVMHKDDIIAALA